MLYIQFLPNFEHYSKKLQRYLIALSMLQEYIEIEDRNLYLSSGDYHRLQTIFESFKQIPSDKLHTELIRIKLPYLLKLELLNYGFSEFYYGDGSFLIPKELVVSYTQESNLYSQGFKTEELYLFDKTNNTSIHTLLTPILEKYDTKVHNRILFNNKYPIKTIIDKQAMISLLTHHKMYDTSGFTQTLKVNLDGYCINPNLARLLGLKQLSTQELLTLLGIDLKELTTYMKTLKKDGYQIILGGLGGAMSNFVYWLEEFCKLTKIDYVFPILHIFEYDELEMTNLFRIPLDYISPSTRARQGRTSKLTMASHLSHCARKIYCYKNTLTPNSAYTTLTRNSYTVIIGSLDATTRFADYVLPTIIPLHKDNDVVIYRNISQNESAQNLLVENYGKIDLTYFFFNMILMTYEIIKDLVDSKVNYQVSENNSYREWEIAKISSVNLEFKDTQKTNYCII